jgi:hypothetical protein
MAGLTLHSTALLAMLATAMTLSAGAPVPPSAFDGAGTSTSTALGDPGFLPQTVAPSLHTTPFVFVHLPKCAGTSTRHVLHATMEALGRPSWQTCIPGTAATHSYTVFNVSECRGRDEAGKPLPVTRDRPFVLAAGHFNYQWTAKVLTQLAEVRSGDGRGRRGGVGSA